MYKVLLRSQQAMVHGIAAHAAHVIRAESSRLSPLPADHHGVSLACKLLISSHVFGRGPLHSVMAMRTWFVLRSGSQGAAGSAERQGSAHQEYLRMPARIHISYRLSA